MWNETRNVAAWFWFNAAKLQSLEIQKMATDCYCSLENNVQTPVRDFPDLKVQIQIVHVRLCTTCRLQWISMARRAVYASGAAPPNWTGKASSFCDRCHGRMINTNDLDWVGDVGGFNQMSNCLKSQNSYVRVQDAAMSLGPLGPSTTNSLDMFWSWTKLSCW